jgi:manganese/zinc/iron transport system permease protein
MNPYSGVGFFQFFALLFERAFLFFSGHLPMEKWAADEVQIAVLLCSALACGWIGPFLVLRKMSMLANSLSHTSLLGVVGAFLFASAGWAGGLSDPATLLIGALFSAILTVGITHWLSTTFRLQSDASISLVFSSLFALGVVFVTLFTRHSHLSAEAVMGNPDALQLSDLRLSGFVALLNGGIVFFLYRRLLLSSFDESFAKSTGIAISFWRALLFLLTAFTCIGAFRAVGVLVVLSLLVGPYLTARLFCHRLPQLLIVTPLLGILSVLIGVALSRGLLTYTDLPLSTGGLISLTIGAFFFLSILYSRLKAA